MALSFSCIRNWHCVVFPSQLFGATPVTFTDFLRPGAEEKLYEDVKDADRLVKLLNDYLEEYNECHHAQVELV